MVPLEGLRITRIVYIGVEIRVPPMYGNYHVRFWSMSYAGFVMARQVVGFL